MLIKIPDEYKAIENLLGRHGIPYEILDEEDTIEVIADKVNFFSSLNKTKLTEILRKIFSK